MELPLICSCLIVSLPKASVQNCSTSIVPMTIAMETMELLQFYTKIEWAFNSFSDCPLYIKI